MSNRSLSPGLAAAPSAPRTAGEPPGSARVASVGPREETQVAARHDVGGRPVRIGLLGTSGAGKTTYQTALAYTLVRQHDSEHDPEQPLYGQPVGQETRQFLSVRVQELVQGRFPLPTNDATELLYKLDTGDRAMLVCIMDYRGGDLSEIYAQDAPTPRDLPPDLQQLARYFLDCDGYIFLVNARVLLLDEQDEQFQRFFTEFLLYKQVLQYLTEHKPRSGGALHEPFALVATQTDAIDLDNEAVRRRLDQALNHLRDEFGRHIRYPATFLTSAIGRHFLDPRTGEKLPHARLEPQNVVAPLRFLLRARRDHRRRRRRRLTLALLVILLGGLALGLGLSWFEAQQRLADVAALAEGVGSRPTALLQRHLQQVEQERQALGLLRLLVPSDGKRAFDRTRSAILRELDEREYRDLVAVTNERPINLDRLERLAAEYLADAKYLGEFGNTRYRDEVPRLLEQARRQFAEDAWQQAQARDDIDGYVAYLDALRQLPEPYYAERAQRRLRQLRLAPYLEEWKRITRRITLHAQDYEENVVLIHGFLEEMKQLDEELRHAVELNPNPYDEFQRSLQLWEQTGWHQLEMLFQERMSIERGDPVRDLLPLIERYENHLAGVGRYKTPAQREAAQARINFLREVSERRTYRVRLLHGTGRLTNEPLPDLYVKVFVNDSAVLETDRRGQLDTNRPVWNADFTFRWRAYDEIRVEVWDENSRFVVFQADALVQTWRDATPHAVQQMFAEPLTYRKTEGDANEVVTLAFEIR